jgi:hypothetical protein
MLLSSTQASVSSEDAADAKLASYRPPVALDLGGTLFCCRSPSSAPVASVWMLGGGKAIKLLRKSRFLVASSR